MSRGQVGKYALGDMAADVIIRKLLDFLAVNQPQVWEKLRQIVTPHLNVAQGGMTIGAEVMALLKDNLRFLPQWAHQILDLGLGQAPMSVVSYFRTHQARADVVAQFGQTMANFDPDALAQQMTDEFIKMPEFKQMAEDAAMADIFRRVEAFQGAMKAAGKSDFRLSLLGKYRQAYDAQQPERDEADDTLVTTFGLWFLRQDEPVSVLMAHLLDAKPPVTDPFDLFTKAGLKAFMEQSEPERLSSLAAMGRPLNVNISTDPMPEPLGGDEPDDPGERYLHRQRGIANMGSRWMEEELGKFSGDPADIVRLFRETYEAIHGPCTPEQRSQLDQAPKNIAPLSLRRRRALQQFLDTPHNAYVKGIETSMKPQEDHDMRTKFYTENNIAWFAEADTSDFEATADKCLMTFEAVSLVLGHGMSALIGSAEAMSGDKKQKRPRR